MQPQLQQRVLRLLHFSLAPQGVLFLGNTETLGELESEFICLQPQWKFYRKRRDVPMSLALMDRKPSLVMPSVSLANNFAQTKFTRAKFDQVLEEVFRFNFQGRKITSVLISRENRLVNVFCNEANVLKIPVGGANLEITDIILPELKLPLSTALHRAQRDKQSVLYTGIKIFRNNQEENITLRVGFNPEDPLLEAYSIVTLELEGESPLTLANTFQQNNYDVAPEVAKRLLEQEYELQQTRENLQAAVEELETINEEQQATNEELLASNEELQSTNEELQSANEELYTINTEYQSKIDELTHLTEDIDNLLRSTDIGVVFLDKNLNIRRFTPAAVSAIKLRLTDIDRPLSDLTHNLDCPDLMEILQQVIDTQQAMEREVTLFTTGEHLLMRVHPFIQESGENSGIVITLVNVNELKNAQSQLQRTNNLLETLYESSPVGLLLVDKELRLLRINPVLAQMSSLPSSEHIGKSISEVLPQLAKQLTPLYTQVLETGKVIRNVEINAPYPAHPEIESWWLATYYPVELENGERLIGVVVKEITQLKQTEQDLLESRNLIQQITDSSPGIIHIFDLEKQCFTYLNSSVKQLLGYTPDRLLEEGANFISSIVHPDDLERVKNHYQTWNNIPERQVVEIEYRLRDKNDVWLWFYTKEVVFKRNSTGKIIEVLGVDTNINEQKQTQQRLEQLNATLEQRVQTRTTELEVAKQKAEVANQAKTEFLSRMTHELRTPLGVILGFAQLLGIADNLDNKQKHQLELISKNGNYLLELIEEVLDFSKLEANRMDLDLTFLDLHSLITESVEMFQLIAGNKGLELRFDIDSQVPQYINSDGRKLRQVLINLLSNAIKFTDRGHVGLNVRVAQISETDRTQESAPGLTTTLEFEISDTGKGISEQDLKQIFDAFVQGEAGRRSLKGTGLGLSISRRFVQLMGGDIDIESSLDVGRTITFSIIVNSISPIATVELSTEQKIIGLAPNQPEYRILVVDDREDYRLLLLIMLESLGFRILEAANGEEAIEQWQQHQPQLILMDLRMPVMNGFEAIEYIKSTPEGKTTTIFALSASGAFNEEQFSFLQANCANTLSKPVEENVLLKSIAEYLNVKYIYGSGNIASAPATTAATVSSLSKNDVSFMSAEFRSQLHDTAIICSSEDVITLLQQIPEEHQQVKAALMKLAVNYRFDLIAKLMEDGNHITSG